MKGFKKKWFIRKIHKSFVAVILLFVSFSILFSQTSWRFEHLTVVDGLFNNFIGSIAQDKSGFMWFATEDGFNKYDGYTFTVYRHDPANASSLSKNNVQVLLVDKTGR